MRAANRRLSTAGRVGRLGLLLAIPPAALHLGFGSQSARDATEADWVNPVSGNWTTSSLWSTNPSYPTAGNPAGASYDAVIAATDSLYTVTQNSKITLTSLTLNSSAATLANNGSLEVDGNLSLQAGEFFLAGSLANASITATGGSFITQSAGSPTLSNITVGTGAIVQVNPTAVITNNLTFAGGSMTAGNGFAGSGITFSGSQSISGTGDILFNAGDLESIVANDTLNIGTGISMRGATVQFTGGTLANAGTLTADGSVPVQGGEPQFTIAPSSFVNTGTLDVINGGTMSIQPQGALARAWTNQGSINETNSTLLLNGSFSTSDLANLHRTGGTVVIGGTLNNAGQTLAMNSTTGIYLCSGVINGGTITDSGSGYLSASGGTLNGVTVSGSSSDPPLALGNEIVNGMTLAGANIQIGGAVTATAPIIGTGSMILNVPSGSVSLKTSAGITLDIPSGINVYTTGTAPTNPASITIGTTANPFSNEGNITIQTANNPTNLIGSTFTNSGTIQVLNGGTLTITGALANSGNLIENNSTLDLAISNFTTALLPTIQRTGGEINLASTYNNTGGTFALTSTTGSLGLTNGGQITGGTVTTSGNSSLYIANSTSSAAVGGILNGVTLAGNMVVEEQGILIVPNALTLQNATITMGTSIFPVLTAGGEGTLMQFYGSSQLNGTGQVLFESTFAGDNIAPFANGSLTIGPGIVIRSDTAGGFVGAQVITQFPGSITNQGLISSQTSGKTISILGAPATNQGTISASNGGLLTITNLVNSGNLDVSGSQLLLNGNATNSGTISLDHGATYFTGGNFTQTSAGDLNFVLTTPPSSRNVTFVIPNATANLDGELSIALANGYFPTLGTTWTILSAGAIDGQFASVNFAGAFGDTFRVQYFPTSVTITAMPEPASMTIVGMAACLLMRRRKRR